MSNQYPNQDGPYGQPPNGPYGQPPNGPYGQPPNAYQHVYVHQPPRGSSITSLVLGLISLVAGFTLVVPVVGFIFGILGVKREPAGRGLAIVGLILNGIMLLGWVLLLIFVFGILGVLGIAATSGAAG